MDVWDKAEIVKQEDRINREAMAKRNADLARREKMHREYHSRECPTCKGSGRIYDDK